MQWIASLRPLIPIHNNNSNAAANGQNGINRAPSNEQIKQQTSARQLKKEDQSDDDDEEAAMREQARLESMEPPSFYEADLKKWH